VERVDGNSYAPHDSLPWAMVAEEGKMTGFLPRSRRAHTKDGRLPSAGASLGLVAVLAMVAALLAGCGGGSKSSTTPTTVSGSATTAATGGSSDSSAQLSSLATAVKAGEQATFKAVYTYSGPGTTGPITIEQKPPKTLFSTSGGEVIGTGTTTYFCSTSSGKASCLSTGTANPLAALAEVFSPESVLTAMQQAAAAEEAHTEGYNVTFSTQSFAGVSADCASVTGQGVTGKYCVTKDGVLAYGGTATASFQLSSYSTNVSESDFALPAGASTETIPAGVTLPGGGTIPTGTP
jgi:hypothetical protein